MAASQDPHRKLQTAAQPLRAYHLTKSPQILAIMLAATVITIRAAVPPVWIYLTTWATA